MDGFVIRREQAEGSRAVPRVAAMWGFGLLAVALLVVTGGCVLRRPLPSPIQHKPAKPASVLSRSILPSGYDSNATRLYTSAYSDAVRRALAGEVQRVNVAPVGFNVVNRTFWGTVNDHSWEPATFTHYFQYLNKQTTLVDFGTWVGPTILYGSQLAGRAFGIEGDPAAYAEVKVNLKLNAGTINNVHLQPGCVGTDEIPSRMRSAAAGNSCSGLGQVACGVPTVSWMVQCYTLPHLFSIWNIDVDSSTFVKIDIESYECKLLPSFIAWLSNRPTKPTLHIAMHAQVTPCTRNEYDAITKLALLYEYAWCGKPLMKDGLDISEQCRIGELILSDTQGAL